MQEPTPQDQNNPEQQIPQGEAAQLAGNIGDKTLDLAVNGQAEPDLVAGENAGRLGHDEAEDIAWAMREYPGTADLLDSTKRRNPERPGRLELYTDQVERHQEAMYDSDYRRTRGKEKQSDRWFHKDLVEASKPFEELYNTNPGLFAEMPAKKFVEEVSKLEEFSPKIDLAKRRLSYLEFQYDDKTLEKWEKGGYGTPSEVTISSLIASVGLDRIETEHSTIYQIEDITHVNMDNADTSDEWEESLDGILSEEDKQALQKVYEDSVNPWTHSGQEVTRGFRVFVQEARKRLGGSLEKMQGDRTAFLDSFRPKDEEPKTKMYSQKVGNEGYVHTTVDENGKMVDIQFPDERED